MSQKQTIDSEEFYNLMQSYRHARIEQPVVVSREYQAVIAHIDAKLQQSDQTTLRDQFAMAAMVIGINCHRSGVVAERAYKIADELIEARKPK